MKVNGQIATSDADILQGIQFPVMNMVHPASIVIDRAAGQLQEFPGQHGGICRSDLPGR